MTNNYKVSVNNADALDISSEEISKLDAIQVSPSKFHILQDKTSYKAEITEANFNTKTYQVKVNNNTYTVAVFNQLDNLIKEMGFEIGAGKKVNDLKAPMPGLILDIMVKIGQEVKEDESLLILEAMKMENVLSAPRDGIIKSISVSKQDTVDKGELLIEFE